MNLECRPPQLTKWELLAAIDVQGDTELYTPCEVAPLLARHWVALVEAPFGGYYYELTAEGKAEQAKLATKGQTL